MSIVESAQDNITAWTWLYGSRTIRNRIPCGHPVYTSVCQEWTKGLVVIDDKLTAADARYFAESGAFVILDPPYMGSGKMGYNIASNYLDGRVDAQAFCVEIMRQTDRWCLFEKPESSLVHMAKEFGATEIERMHGRKQQTVDETMLVCLK